MRPCQDFQQHNGTLEISPLENRDKLKNFWLKSKLKLKFQFTVESSSFMPVSTVQNLHFKTDIVPSNSTNLAIDIFPTTIL